MFIERTYTGQINMIRELLQARDGQLDIPPVSMSPCEVRTLLEYVCTM